MGDDFELLGTVRKIETIAVNLSVRERAALKLKFGGKRWRKRKGIAQVKFPDGTVHEAEVHWYEAHGIGRKKLKIKRRLD